MMIESTTFASVHTHVFLLQSSLQDKIGIDQLHRFMQQKCAAFKVTTQVGPVRVSLSISAAVVAHRQPPDHHSDAQYHLTLDNPFVAV